MMQEFLTLNLGHLLTVLTMIVTITWAAGRFRGELMSLGMRLDHFEATITNISAKLEHGIGNLSELLTKVALQEQRIAALEDKINGRVSTAERRRKRA